LKNNQIYQTSQEFTLETKAAQPYIEIQSWNELTPADIAQKTEALYKERLRGIQNQYHTVIEKAGKAERATGLEYRREYLSAIQAAAIELLNISRDGLADLFSIEQALHMEETRRLKFKLEQAIELARV
jgi:hypothetical protein